eukprot:TRINITY_DN39905_c0_g1_i1.p1 TRINITY_DN39905_c0_g1~~TRINITY_DN39905_c0_g1_i1.p1  ORF type:complete len:259 (-),score=51.93 TRINITY_DN39905_c0_g1_i1:8-763(-)
MADSEHADAAAKARARAEARRQRLLARSGERLSRLGTGLDTEELPSASCEKPPLPSDRIEERQGKDSEPHSAGLRARRREADEGSGEVELSTSKSVPSGPQKPPIDAADAWALSLRARRHERGCRFFGSVLLAALYSLGVFTFFGLEGCPPLAGFALLELIIFAVFGQLPGQHRSAGASLDVSGEQLVAAVLSSALGGSLGKKGSQALVHLSLFATLASTAWKMMQDSVWFLFVFLTLESSKDMLPLTFRS